MDSRSPAHIDVAAVIGELRCAHDLGVTSEHRLEEKQRFGSAWTSFRIWCEHHGFGDEVRPVSPDALGTWLVWAAPTLSEARIASTLAAIRAAHDAAGLLGHIEELGA